MRFQTLYSMYRGTKQNNKEHLQTGELMRFIWIYLLNGCVQMEMVSRYTDDEPLFLKNIGYCVEEIDCSDISDGESRREKVVVYRVGEK